MGRKPKYSKEVKIKACKDYENGDISFSGIADDIELSLDLFDLLIFLNIILISFIS